MIRIYSHQDPATMQWQSPDEFHKLWPTTKPHGWNTDIFINQLNQFRDSAKYFEVREYTPDIKRPGQYLMFCGTIHHLQDHAALSVIPVDVRDKVNEGMLDLLVVFTHESFDDRTLKEWQDQFCTRLNRIGITRADSVKVLLGTNSLEMGHHRDWRVKWIYYPFCEAMYQQQAQKFFHNQELLSTDFSDRKHKFLFLGGVLRVHRLIMALYLEYMDLQSHGLISFQPSQLPWDHYVAKGSVFHYGISCNPDFKIFLEKNKVLSGTYLNSNDRHNNTQNVGWFNTDELHRQCMIEVVNETHHAMWNCTFLTEKTYRPIVYGMPFMINGCRGSLHTLRQCGYQTFPELFEEGYDDMNAGIGPVMHIVQNLKNICDRPDLMEVLQSSPVQEKLKYNQRLFWERNHTQMIHDALL